jgi:hypothetical protein
MGPTADLRENAEGLASSPGRQTTPQSRHLPFVGASGADRCRYQTIPGQGWFAYFRFYGPTEPYFSKSWQLNDIELIQS